MNWQRVEQPTSRAHPKNAPVTDRHRLIVAMLSSQATFWTPAKVADLIATQDVPDSYIAQVTQYIKNVPALWTVGDDEFIAGVQAVSPPCAALLAAPRGLDLLHLMSRKLALKTGVALLSGLFGGD